MITPGSHSGFGLAVTFAILTPTPSIGILKLENLGRLIGFDDILGLFD
ncbi:hypothetical protein AO385_2162 [Moraxella catarrhalis]|uniref:Uncharacterized protein n=1 Tax=Moraxella catarrhalis TaxID=480 RepID=A0A198UUY5_MORCA|nr:hypothetical protein AO385_2162 [Moraxella catarrhalis]OAU95471.1 hypothetical protein AO383_1938 [Moraxella catarrhalis]OAU96985.1 hypothetical protein AO384_0794 [Moraxella catarrhalis]OAV00070.1 hypothetical protein AO382_1667 [Moraxella catarrhalis]